MGIGNSSDSNSFVADNVPLDIWIEVLLNVDDSTLDKCRRVNKTFHSIFHSSSFWTKRCLKYSIIYPKQHLDSVRKVNFKKIYLCKPYGRNLIKNPSGEDGMNHWTYPRHGHNTFIIEQPPCGADNVDGINDFSSCFATSYTWCIKDQFIDLKKEGCDNWVMDELKPTITVSEWVAGRFDCGSINMMKVYLLRNKVSVQNKNLSSWGHEVYNSRGEPHEVENDNNVIDSCEYITCVDQWTGGKWKQITHTFTEYGEGVRYILFQSCGKDTQFWQGHYGSKMAKASVILSFD